MTTSKSFRSTEFLRSGDSLCCTAARPSPVTQISFANPECRPARSFSILHPPSSIFLRHASTAVALCLICLAPRAARAQDVEGYQVIRGEYFTQATTNRAATGTAQAHLLAAYPELRSGFASVHTTGLFVRTVAAAQ